MKYSFHPEAEKELVDAINYYNKCQDNLGLAFAKEVYSSIHNILQYPQAWPQLSLRTRRCLVHRFPYGIVYQISEQEIYIIAVMQLNRKPKYWKNRNNS